jgi:hypothetical protein
MPKPAHEVASHFRKKMKDHAEYAMTVSWPDFYEACGRHRWTDKAYDETHSAFLEEGLILGYGNEFVVIAEDKDFSPS